MRRFGNSTHECQSCCGRTAAKSRFFPPIHAKNAGNLANRVVKGQGVGKLWKTGQGMGKLGKFTNEAERPKGGRQMLRSLNQCARSF